MSLVDRISADLKDAMRARDQARTLALRNIRAAFIEALKSDGSTELPDEAAMAILRSLGKRRRESVEAYQAAGRDDLVAEESAELAVIEAYLPQLADDATLSAWIEAAIAEVGATGPREMGKVMGALNKAHKGEFDGGRGSALVKARLGG